MNSAIPVVKDTLLASAMMMTSGDPPEAVGV